MNLKNKGLGRGLDAIFDMETIAHSTKGKGMMDELELSVIRPNPKQPRTKFDEDALEELADSIKSLGVIQPITVKKDGGGYMIISGERRWRASQMAGLKSIPAYIKEASDQNLHEMALVENIQRQDLNAIEVALGLQRLIDECNLTQDSLAERVGKKRSTVANYMRLLKLPVEIQASLQQDIISMGHAKAMASLEKNSQQLQLLRKIAKKNLSVRQTEDEVRSLLDKKPPKAATVEEEYHESYIRLVEQLERMFTTDISIKKSPKGGGKIVIGFSADEDIQKFLEQLEGDHK